MALTVIYFEINSNATINLILMYMLWFSICVERFVY